MEDTTGGGLPDVTGDNGSTGASAGATVGEPGVGGCSCRSAEEPGWPMGGPSLLLLLLGAAGVHRRRTQM